jgi:hypothetical protein
MLFDYFLADRRLGFVDLPGFAQVAVNRSPVDGVDHHIDIGIAGHQHPHRFPSLPAVASEKPPPVPCGEAGSSTYIGEHFISDIGNPRRLV